MRFPIWKHKCVVYIIYAINMLYISDVQNKYVVYISFVQNKMLYICLLCESTTSKYTAVLALHIF